MNSDKKLKKLVEKTGSELKTNHNDFYNRMINTYYAETQTAKKKVSIWAKPRFLATMACCFMVMCFAGVGIGIGLNQKPVTPSITISLPSNAETVQSLNAETIDTSALTEVNKPLAFAGNGLAIGDVEIYEDSNENGTNFFYVTSSGTKGSFYSLQLILDPAYKTSSHLKQNVSTVSIEGKATFKYSVVYVENVNMVYFFAEAENNNEKLIIDYTTTETNCEEAFISFLKQIID